MLNSLKPVICMSPCFKICFFSNNSQRAAFGITCQEAVETKISDGKVFPLMEEGYAYQNRKQFDTCKYLMNYLEKTKNYKSNLFI